MAEHRLVSDRHTLQHTEDCPADRDDCTCGGYVPVAEVERLRDALREIAEALPTAGTTYMREIARGAFDEEDADA